MYLRHDIGRSVIVPRSTLNGTGPGDVYKPHAEVSGQYLPPLEIIFLLVAIGPYSLRIYGRVIILKSGGIDDIFVTLALLLAIALTVLHLLALGWGLGRHWVDLYTPTAELLWQSEFISQWLHSIAQMFTKLSILTFYRRFMGPKSRIGVYITGVFIIIWTIGSCIAISLSCDPIAKFWSYEGTGTCWPMEVDGILLFLQVALNLVSDVIVFIIPIRTIWMIQVSKKEKIRMIGLLGLGLLVCIIALVRIKLIMNWLLSSENDQPWNLYIVYVVMAIELDITIAVACLPFCRPVTSALRSNKSVRKMSSTLKSISRGKSSAKSTYISMNKTNTTESRVPNADSTAPSESNLHADTNTIPMNNIPTDDRPHAANQGEGCIYKTVEVEVSEHRVPNNGEAERSSWPTYSPNKVVRGENIMRLEDIEQAMGTGR